MDRCDECGFEYDLTTATDAGGEILHDASALADLIRGNDRSIRTRPAAEVWSPLEYACHVRDVLLVQRERLLDARRTERPSFPPMGRDERVDHDGYAEQDPAAVARQLTDAAAMCVNVLDRLGPADWDRTMIYNFPRPTERSLRWVAVHTLHEARHHLLDARRPAEPPI